MAHFVERALFPYRKNPLVNIMEKRENILNSSLSSGPQELIIVLVVLGLPKPFIDNQNSRSVGDPWTPESSK